jgi:hypothetical protein
MEKNKPDVIIDADEFAVAEKEAEQSAYTYTHKFKRPFEYQGKTFNELTFDWGKLTGRDGLAIENELQQIGKAVIVPTFSGDYLIRMAARACTVTYCSMPLRTCLYLTSTKFGAQPVFFTEIEL